MIIGAIILTIMAVAANIGDVLTTQRGLALGAREANPFARWVFKVTSVQSAYWLKGLMALALAWVLRNFSVEVYCAVAFVMAATGSFATAHNTGVIARIMRRRAAGQ